MIDIQKVTPSEYVALGLMIQKTIMVSWNSYPPALLDIFCQKYTPPLIEERAHTMDIWIAIQDEVIVGCIALKQNQLKTFFVASHMQGKGIGSKLYYHLEEKAKERKITKLVLEGSTRGQPIYEHFGFVAIHSLQKERIGIQYTDTFMEKCL